MTRKEYEAALRRCALAETAAAATISYRTDSPEYALLREKYPVCRGRDTAQDTALKLLGWVNGHIRHRGDYDNSDRQDALTLLDAAFDTGYGLNCLSMSVVLAECLLAAGVRARVMYMMPQRADDGDNHVVTEAFIPEKGKWVMLDATYGCVCTGPDGEMLNLYEMRQMAARGQEYAFSAGLNYNGDGNVDREDLREYYAKNMFFFRCKSRQGYGEHRAFGNMLEIAPEGFDVHARMVENLEYRIKTWGECGLFCEWKEYEESLCNRYAGAGRVWENE